MTEPTPPLTNGNLVAAVREKIATAIENNKTPPGRRTLATELGTTVWQIRQAMTRLDQPAPTPAAESDGGRPRAPRWPLLLLALPAFVAIWGGWVGLGRLTGFGPIHPLPGIWDKLTLDSAITLPIGLETYAAYALSVWLSDHVADPGARRFAKISAITSLIAGAAGQVAYHLMTAYNVTTAPWPVTTLVATLPVAVLGMGATLAHLITRTTPTGADTRPTPHRAENTGSIHPQIHPHTVDNTST